MYALLVYLCASQCVCVRACVCVCVRVRVTVRVCESMCVCDACACMYVRTCISVSMMRDWTRRCCRVCLHITVRMYYASCYNYNNTPSAITTKQKLFQPVIFLLAGGRAAPRPQTRQWANSCTWSKSATITTNVHICC